MSAGGRARTAARGAAIALTRVECLALFILCGAAACGAGSGGDGADATCRRDGGCSDGGGADGARATHDGGAIGDAGGRGDAGTVHDGGTARDAGARADGGPRADGGSHTDAGARDAGQALVVRVSGSGGGTVHFAETAQRCPPDCTFTQPGYGEVRAVPDETSGLARLRGCDPVEGGRCYVARAGGSIVDVQFDRQAASSRGATLRVLGTTGDSPWVGRAAIHADGAGGVWLAGRSTETTLWPGIPALAQVGSSRVDLQACKLEYSIVSPK